MPKKTSKPQSPADRLPIPVEMIQRRIFATRGEKVMLDTDLAEIYQVQTFNLNKAVKRNLDRFPADFMFQLTKEEAESLTFQFGMSKKGRGGRRTLPYAFTEQGVAMLATVLNSPRAIQVSIQIVRAFVKLRQLLATNKEFAARLEKIERTQTEHRSVINILATEIMRLKKTKPPQEREPPKRRYGFQIDDK